MKAIITHEGARKCGTPYVAGHTVEVENWDGQMGDIVIGGEVYARNLHKDGTNDGVPSPTAWVWCIELPLDNGEQVDV